MHAQDRATRLPLRAVDHDAAIEAPRPKKRGVEDVGAVGRRHHHRVVVRREPVHLRQELVQRLLAFVVASTETGAARTSDRVDLVDEDDRGRCCLRLVEDLSDPCGAHADEELNELRSVYVEERGLRFPGDRACEERLSRARGTDQEHASRKLPPEALESLGRSKKIHDLLKVALHIREAGNVVEVDPHVVLPLEPMGTALEDALERPADSGDCASRAPREPDPRADDEHPRKQRHHERGQEGLLLRFDPNVDVFVSQHRKKARVLLRGQRRREVFDGLAVDCRRVLERPRDVLPLDCDTGDLAVVDERIERRVVDPRIRRLPFAERFRSQQQRHEQQGHRPPEPCQGALRTFLVAVGIRHGVALQGKREPCRASGGVIEIHPCGRKTANRRGIPISEARGRTGCLQPPLKSRARSRRTSSRGLASFRGYLFVVRGSRASPLHATRCR